MRQVLHPITEDGHPVKLFGDLAVGESGYVSTGYIRDAGIKDDAPVWPTVARFYDCYHVTRTESGADVRWLSGDDREVEKLVFATTAPQFLVEIDQLVADGWRLDRDSIRAAPERECFIAVVTRDRAG